jgi:serine/threonine protein phosphatase 1
VSGSSPPARPAGRDDVVPGALPPGLRIYAIGDVHGRLDLLTELHDRIRRDFVAAPAERAVEIFLGDYIDRGPASRQVVEWLLASKSVGGERICLLGNHEDMVLRALRDPLMMEAWLYNGGLDTLRSYRVSVDLETADPLRRMRRDFQAALPPAHYDFMRGLPRTVSFGGYFFVHAGLSPERPLDAQKPDDLVWIREPFLSSDADFGRIVVHGHTPCAAPEIRPNRINIDTGAFFTGRLTCVALEDVDRRFLQVAV